MNTEHMPGFAVRPKRQGKPRWSLAFRIAVVTFLAVGGGLFLWGWVLAFPPPLPPGVIRVGFSMVGGWFLMVFGAPLSAIVVSFATWMIGTMIEDHCNNTRRPAPGPDETPLHSYAQREAKHTSW